MSQKQHKQDQDQAFGIESLGLEVIIPALLNSELSEGKKLAYLYMIAEGSFSLQTLKDISEEMKAIESTMEQEKWNKKAEIAQMEQELAALEAELDDLAVQYAEDLQGDTEVLVARAKEEVERGMINED